MSSKNKLQEFFQKRQEPLPVYATEKDPLSESHQPRWKSIVTVHGGKRFVGEYTSKKSDAESSAAQLALKTLRIDSEEKVIPLVDYPSLDCLSTPHDVFHNCMDASTIVFIDIENIPQAIDMVERVPSNTVIVGVVGHCHSKVEAKFPFFKYIVRNAMKDAVDHAMSFLAGFVAGGIHDNLILPDHKDFPDDMPKFLIVSRDHYAEITCHCIKQQGFDAVHITTMTDLLRYLNPTPRASDHPKKDANEEICNCGSGLPKSCDCGCNQCAHRDDEEFDLFD